MNEDERGLQRLRDLHDFLVGLCGGDIKVIICLVGSYFSTMLATFADIEVSGNREMVADGASSLLKKQILSIDE